MDGVELIQSRRSLPIRPLPSRNHQRYLESLDNFSVMHPEDEYGPLNIPSRLREPEYNPGGVSSFYDIYGVYTHDENMNRILNPDGTEYNPAFDIEQAIEVIPEVIPVIYRRGRSGGPPYVPSEGTRTGKCPVTLKQIVVPFLLEADGCYYEANTIQKLHPDARGVFRSPLTRAEFTESDLDRRNILVNAYMPRQQPPARDTGTGRGNTGRGNTGRGNTGRGNTGRGNTGRGATSRGRGRGRGRGARGGKKTKKKMYRKQI